MPAAVERTADGIVIRGVVLTDGPHEPVAREDWRLTSEGNDLVCALNVRGCET